MSELPLDFWALDIETDNSKGHGLDPTKAQVISIALVSNSGQVWYRSAATAEQEASMLSDFRIFLVEELWGCLLLTWNGGAFDWPFLTTRMNHHGVSPAWKLSLHESRLPKYEPLNEWDGVQSVWLATRARHLDMAYVMDRKWAEEHGCSWSLKPVAHSLGFCEPISSTRGEDAHGAAPHILAAYNIHDALITLRLALWALAFEDNPAMSLGMTDKLD
jgi:DNA polymerase elongation subunit (family B)